MASNHSALPVFLPERLLESCEDDVDLAREVIQDFRESAPRGLSRLTAAVAATNADRVYLEAHALTGISRTIGAEALAAACAGLEAAGRARDTAGLSLLLSEVRRRMEVLQAPLDAFLAD